MKKLFPFLVLGWFTISHLQAQNSISGKTIQAYLDKASFSKVYVQLDRETYLPGDWIHYKAYVLDAGKHTLNNRERILYVEFYAPNGKLEEKQVVKIDEGTANGQIKTSNGLSAGEYTLVAYTNWSRNFEDEVVYARKILFAGGAVASMNVKFDTKVVGTSKGDSVYLYVNMDPSLLDPGEATEVNAEMKLDKFDALTSRINLTGKKQGVLKFFVTASDAPATPVLNIEAANGDQSITKSIPVLLSSNKPDVQLLPEGGVMLEGELNRVGVKAIAPNGTPVNYTGMLISSTVGEVARFASTRDGMATFEFTPKRDANYSVSFVSEKGYTYTSELSGIKKSGVAIRARLNAKFGYDITIVAKNDKIKSLSYVLYNASKTVTGKAINANGNTSFTINEEELPVGTSRILVIGNNNIPLCERMLFRYPMSKVNLVINADKQSYTSREKVRLGLALPGSEDFQIANMAVSVVEDQMGKDDDQENILSYLLVNSEIKGRLQNPTWYVAEKSMERAKALDLVLLTHGWSRFDAEKVLLDKVKPFQYERDSLLYFRGVLRNNLTHSTLKNYNLQATLSRKGKSASVGLISDNDGKFQISMPDFYEQYAMQLFISNRKNKQADVMLEIETPYSLQTMDMIKFAKESNIDQKLRPIDNLPTILNNVRGDEVGNGQVGFEFKSSKSKQVRKDNYYAPGGDTISLPVLDIVEKRLTNSRAIFAEKFGTPDVILEAPAIRKLAEETKNYSSIWDLILDDIPGLRWSWEFVPALDEDNVSDGRNLKERQRMMRKIANNNIYALWPDEPSQTGESDASVLFLYDVARIYVDNLPVKYMYDLVFIDPQDVIAVEYVENVGLDNLADAIDALGGTDTYIPNKNSLKNSVISITLRPGAGGAGSANKGIYTGDLKGFNKYRKFYVPNYSSEEVNKSVITDNRKTLFWDPTLKLQGNQSKVLSFYTSDSEKPVQVMVEGITNTGIPFYAKKTLDMTPVESEPELAQKVSFGKVYDTFKKAKANGNVSKKTQILVVDEKNKTPLEFAFIKVRNDDYGQVTNADGQALLPLKKNIQGLTVSMPGYQQVNLNAAEVQHDTLLVELARGGLLALDAHENNAVALIKKVIKNLNHNYPSERVNTAFYSERVYQDNWITALNESVVNYMCSSTLKGDVSSKVEWKRHRSFKTFDYREKIKFEPSHKKESFIVNSDVVANRKYFLIERYMDWFEYSIKGKTVINDRTCYMVQFDQKKEKAQALNKGMLYIDEETLAIVRASYSISPRGIPFVTYPTLVHENYNYDNLEPLNTKYEAQYYQRNDGTWNLMACREELEFAVNRAYVMRFDKNLIVNYTSSLDQVTIRANKFDDLEKKVWLLAAPSYTKDFWSRYIRIQPTQEILDNMKFLHEETLYMGRR